MVKTGGGKVGILKPEGSLERSWENHQEQVSSNSRLPVKFKSNHHVTVATNEDNIIITSPPEDDDPLPSSNGSAESSNANVNRSRTRNNVALQAILKRNNASESKQVCFYFLNCIFFQ